MFIYKTGDLLKSSAEALVNTVNCEGYMGKGIAYQFKLEYPQNNEGYIRACKSGNMKVGKIFWHKEKGKIIMNFPTKDKWRAKSKIEYIDSGLDDLIKLIKDMDINSIAIPPLGSGNGGLVWGEVKKLIENKLSSLPEDKIVYIYEPSRNYSSQPDLEPKLTTSALVLMEIKNKLDKFDTLRLQKTAYFMNIFSESDYFRFKGYKHGPYDNSINIISRSIKEFQEYHKVYDTREAYKILYNKIVSGNVEHKLNELIPYIEEAARYVNSIESNHDLECISTILFLIDTKTILNYDQIISEFKNWSNHKSTNFSEMEISQGIKNLQDAGIIEKTLIGYSVSEFKSKVI
jgi:O-acetyl-ADP-ribose deacetylase (regulator of RNase III)